MDGMQHLRSTNICSSSFQLWHWCVLNSYCCLLVHTNVDKSAKCKSAPRVHSHRELVQTSETKENPLKTTSTDAMYFNLSKKVRGTPLRSHTCHGNWSKTVATLWLQHQVFSQSVGAIDRVLSKLLKCLNRTAILDCHPLE